MARTAIRTANVSRDGITRMIDLFGTIANAHRRLGLEALVPYPIFYRAMHDLAVKPHEKDLIEESWERWQSLYLRPEVPSSDGLTLTPMNRDMDPEWLERLET